jgi:hypothetical protein
MPAPFFAVGARTAHPAAEHEIFLVRESWFTKMNVGVDRPGNTSLSCASIPLRAGAGSPGSIKAATRPEEIAIVASALPPDAPPIRCSRQGRTSAQSPKVGVNGDGPTQASHTQKRNHDDAESR